ncbi:hypothetical protein NDU88_003829 [Pleurodeles waltl]|uniref:Uncharacterized protein n=1 Tax=Pleurodeles waltl TaxID=8319 RepID=A0AAV7MWQ8_PLEWA|nr:hypothetical protein NDU88_003829 [Pleurodeles waltl]
MLTRARQSHSAQLTSSPAKARQVSPEDQAGRVTPPYSCVPLSPQGQPQSLRSPHLCLTWGPPAKPWGAKQATLLCCTPELLTRHGFPL